MIFAIATFLANRIAFSTDTAANFEIAKLWARRVVIVIPMLLIIVAFIGVNSFCSSRNDRKLDRVTGRIIETKVEANTAANVVNAAEKEQTDAQTNTNNALFDFNASVNRDSSDWANLDKLIIEDRYCRRFPNDSTCGEWRERTGHNSSTPR